MFDHEGNELGELWDDADDTDFITGKPRPAPPRPEEVSDYFTRDHEGNPALSYAKIGADLWARVTTLNLAEDFEHVRNPDAKHPVRVSLWLGVERLLQERAERLLVKAPRRMSVGAIRARLDDPKRPGLSLRGEFLRCHLEIPQLGTVTIPRVWCRALRGVRDGVVVSGLAPRIQVVGESDPPALSVAFMPRKPSPLDPKRRLR